jgi:hypothetical protein
MTLDGMTKTDRLLAHYDKVKARIGNPYNMPAKNRIKEILAAVAARKAAEREEKERHLAAARIDRAARRRKDQVKRAILKTPPAITDVADPMAGCTVKNKAVREAVKLILERHRVTWALVVSPIRVQHVVQARATIITLLSDLGCSGYEIGKELGKDSTSVYSLLKRYASQVRDNAAFLDAFNCVKNNGQVI